MIAREIVYRNPLACCAALAHLPHTVFLDSAASTHQNGRYSYLATDPAVIITANHQQVWLNDLPILTDPFTLLRQQLAAYKPATKLQDETLPPFRGGAIGYLGYELGTWLENLPVPKHSPDNIPTMVVGIYPTIAAFDQHTQRCWIFAPDEKAADALIEMLDSAPTELPTISWQAKGWWQAEQSQSEVENNISRVLEYIKAGDIYQANFTQRLICDRPAGLDDFTLYRRLRQLSPAPYAGFMRCGKGLTLASASPENFLQLDNAGQISTQPIKGTRHRSLDPIEDQQLAAELVASIKDRAENLMIVDLLRNDLSRITKIGSVQVPQLIELETFTSVHHLVSTITAQLANGLDAIDLLRASFPGGSITGAPKIRAMEIIHELEPVPRGAYCGSMGWLGFDGAMNLNIIIRTLTCLLQQIIAQAGGGIVADSEPAAEYEESMIKLAPLLQAVAR